MASRDAIVLPPPLDLRRLAARPVQCYSVAYGSLKAAAQYTIGHSPRPLLCLVLLEELGRTGFTAV